MCTEGFCISGVRDTLLDRQGRKALSVEYDSCSLGSKGLDPVDIIGVPSALQHPPPTPHPLLPLGALVQEACQQAYSTA